MVAVIFIEPDGNRRTVEVPAGSNLMQAALDNGVDGILGDCGGACSCATCHCYIDESTAPGLPAATSVEASMLDFAIEPRPNSRLGCQVTVTEELHGLVVELPQTQV